MDATTTRESMARKAIIGAPGTDRMSCIASSAFTLRPFRQRSRSSTNATMMSSLSVSSLNTSVRKSKSSFSSFLTVARKPNSSLTVFASLKILSPRLWPLSLALWTPSPMAGTAASNALTAAAAVPMMPLTLSTADAMNVVIKNAPVTSSTRNVTAAAISSTSSKARKNRPYLPYCFLSAVSACRARQRRLKCPGPPDGAFSASMRISTFWYIARTSPAQSSSDAEYSHALKSTKMYSLVEGRGASTSGSADTLLYSYFLPWQQQQMRPTSP
mmetsp:Transcript_2803/g.8649  ORF Transcript_2803/g.8649 Transcript_2803/m.8649 type:complete len:272 (-) Transcript_2803:281-1096(-)